MVKLEREPLLKASSDEVLAYLTDNPVICELCGIKPAKKLLPLSLQFCCVSDGRKCRAAIPHGALCPYCGELATIKWASGLVCCKKCPGYATRRHETIKQERKQRFSIPEYTKTFLEKRRQTNLAKYGVEHPSTLLEVRNKISAGGKTAAKNLSPNAKQRIEEARHSKNRKDRKAAAGIADSLTIDERQEISFLPQARQRDAMASHNIVCEICKVRRGLYILKNSLMACCERRAITCKGTPELGDLCYGCSSPATTKTRLGFVCGSHHWDGCQKLFDERIERKTGTFNERMKDPSARKQRQTKHEETMLERHGVKASVLLPSWKTSIQGRFGVDNPAQSEEIKKQKIKNSISRHGVEHPSQLESTKEACRKTCQERYGVDNPGQSEFVKQNWLKKYGARHPFQNQEFYQSKISPALFKRHNITLLSGRAVSYQGYEKYAIRHLLKSFPEDDILFNGSKELFFKYVDPNDKEEHAYYPDLGIRSKQTIIEVKSTYTLKLGLDDGSLLPKVQSVQQAGWLPIVQVWSEKGKLLSTLWLDDVKKLNDTNYKHIHRLARQRKEKVGVGGYQWHVRQIYNEIDPRPPMELVNPEVREISKSQAESIILKYEWLQSMAPFTIAYYGLFVGGDLLGVSCFSEAVGNTKNLFQRKAPVGYLSRGACVHYAGRNAGSFLVSHACKLVSKKFGWKAIFAYNDEEAGEGGFIYRACNWLYLGKNTGRRGGAYHCDYVSPDDGRSIITSYQLNHDKNRKILKKLGWDETKGAMRPYLKHIGWTEVRQKGKGKWVWLANHKDARFLKVSPSPYPK